MIVLGWHGGVRRVFEDAAPGWSTHDGAAVLLRDGEIIAAIEEERLNRIKHSNFFPSKAIKFCMNYAGIDFSEIACIAMNFAEMPERVFPRDAGRPSPDMFLDDLTMQAATVRAMICDLFRSEFSADISGKLFFCHHHLAHLWSAVYSSGFNESLVVSVDGSGDALSGMVGVVEGDRLNILRQHSVEQSLGDLYSDTIRLLGFKRFDEYKAMGLAPYGNPATYSSIFNQFYELLPAGDYRLIDRTKRWELLQASGLLKYARRADEPFTQLHQDIAAALQDTVEKVIFHVLGYFQQETQQHNLCLAGGVGHNCTVNGKILRSNKFKNVFVHPASHDAGGALGSAVAAYKEVGKSVPRRTLQHLYYGSDIGNEIAIHRELDRWTAFISFEKVDGIAERAASLLSEGKVIAWVQGRSEFGPRALGNRSILADPRPADHKRLINQMVKKREGFRPFAPSICEEYLRDFFEVPTTETDYSTMIYVLNVREEWREKLGAVTHIDGTARLQTVSRSANPRYWELIHEFGRLTGIPIVLNTSFNNNAEPIVDSVQDAVVCFLTTEINYLVVGDYLITKRELRPSDEAYLVLVPSLPCSQKLVRRMRPDSRNECGYQYSIETTASRHFAQTYHVISSDVYSLLLAAARNRDKSLHVLCEELQIQSKSRLQSILHELFELWSNRVLVLTPLSVG